MIKSGESILPHHFNACITFMHAVLFCVHNLMMAAKNIFELEAGCSDDEEDFDLFDFSQGDLDFIEDSDADGGTSLSPVVCYPELSKPKTKRTTLISTN